MFRQLGSFGLQLKDDSGFDNHGAIVGSTSKSAGHIDGLDAMNTNGTTDYARIPNTGWINTAGGTVTPLPGSPSVTSMPAMTSMSISLWSRPRSVSLTSGNRPRILAHKVDARSGSTPIRGWSIWVVQDGTVWFAYRHSASQTYAINFSNKMNRLDDWYDLDFTLSNIGGSTIPKIYVNGQVSVASVVTNIPPQFPNTASGALDLFIAGTDEGSGIARVQGATGDFRIWRDKLLTQAEVTAKWSNKYSISDIENVARVGASYIAVEAVEGPGNPGEEPNPPPDPLLAASFSALAFMPESYTIDELNTGAPGGMGISGGGVGTGVDPAIPSQLLDSFNNPISYYTLTTLNQVSPNLKWKLITLPGTGGYVRTESYTHPGEQGPANVLRMRSGTGSPTIVFNTAKFAEFYARFTLRTISKVVAGDLNTAHIIFSYVDSSNYYYLVLKPSNLEVRKVIAGVDTTVATGPTRSNVFQTGSIHTIEMWLKQDGVIIDIIADNDAANSRLTVTAATGAIPDVVVSAVAPMAIRAQSSEIQIDDFLVRPLLSDGFENGSPWTLISANTVTRNGKWKMEVAPGTGGQCRSTTTGGGTFNHILDLRHGTASPILISQTTFTNLLMEWEHKTNSQTTVAQNNRLWIIFSWLNASNYYYFVTYPTGWQIRRVISGVDELRVSSTSNGLADATTFSAGHYKILVTNSGLDFELRKGVGTGEALLYKEEGGVIKTPAAGGTNVETVASDDDDGVLAGPGKVGFKAMNCDADVAFIDVSAS
jgi:Concanavalin A-like lectin/glucanases superfamily